MEHAEKKKFKLRREDMIAISVLIIFLIIMAIPIYAPKDGCEVARAGYKCESIENVMIENCEYWSEFNCNTEADNSLVQIEWYIGELCKLQNQEHKTGLDCNNLQYACNQISGQELC